MPTITLTVSTHIRTTPAKAFAYVADLTRHSEWAANPLQIVAVAPSAVSVGSRFRSAAQVRGLAFEAELQVTTYQPLTQFGFAGQDATGRFEHLFVFHPDGDGVRVERQIQFTLTVRQWVMFYLLLYPVRLPAARQALQLLKARLEQTGGG